MKVCLMNKQKIKKYVLPEKIEDFFTMSYSEGDVEGLITIEAENQNWVLKSNGNINIIENNNVVEKVELKEYNFHLLKVEGLHNYVIMYIAPTVPSQLLKLKTIDKITIGSNTNCNISYKNSYTKDIQAEITLSENRFLLLTNEDSNSFVYVNDYKTTKKYLEIGDTIFVNGLKIIWMRDFLEINNPDNKVAINGLQQFVNEDVNNHIYKEVDLEEQIKPLYNEDEYFAHIPRITERIETKELNIDPPPNNENKDDMPLILSLGTSVTIMASSMFTAYTVYDTVSTGRKTISQAMPQILLCIAMLFGSVAMPRIIASYQKKKRIKREDLRQTKYKEYLAEREMKITGEKTKQKEILNANNPDAVRCIEIIKSMDKDLWSREKEDEDFLNIRVGTGTIDAKLKINAPEERFTLDEDNLVDLVLKVKENAKIIEEVPITASLTEQKVISIVEQCTYSDNYINNFITQIIALHSSNDVKIVVLTDEIKQKKWEYMKYIPHIFSEDKQTRYFANNPQEAKILSSQLEQIFQARKEKISNNQKTETGEEIKKEKEFRNFDPYYIIITDNYRKMKTTPILEQILKTELNLGFTLLAIEKSIRNLPNNCDSFIQLGEKDGCVLGKKIDSTTQREFKNDLLPILNMEELSIKLSNIPTNIKDANEVLPSTISFLEMFGVSKIEHLNVLNRWQENNPVISLKAAVGVHKDGEPFYLDLHEKFHGPHGLIAGMTGSGKSEFIITYILSMALNYHPYEVQFVLIDYKGGGLAGAFENKETKVKIPHLAGTITNLDTNEMNRTLVSIESELKRRQKIFNEVRDKLGESTIDIYKYQKLYREGLVEKPMAHLFIISDEFAELKSQQPEFMQQLIQTARIGRSLGMHLILATQKPSGVVNDQIWSNSKFKVCLKVQDRSDSNEMLKKPDAASLKEAGRFYLQVGYDEYFDIGQSGWAGAKYTPTNRVIKKIDDGVDFINNTGLTIKTIKDLVKSEKTEDYGDQLVNLVKHISSFKEKENLTINTLWLDKIEEIINIKDLIVKYNHKKTPFKIEPIIGEYDKPINQEQGLLKVDLTNKGNLVIYGMTGSGKEKLLTTLIWNMITTYTPEEINIYIIDCGAETLKKYANAPQIGEIALTEEADKIYNILDFINDEIERRKTLFQEFNGSYTSYLELSGNKLPLITIVINGFEMFYETYPKFNEGMQSFFRDGPKFGIVFVVATAQTQAIKLRMQQNFLNKITLQLPQDSDYRTILPAPRSLTPTKYLGRGLITMDDTAVEFQTATICEDRVLNQTIKALSQKLNETFQTKAKRILTLPDIITFDHIKQYIKDYQNIPVGFDPKKKLLKTFNFTKSPITLVLSNVLSDKMTFVTAVIKSLRETNTNTIVYDLVNLYKEDSIKDNLFEEIKNLPSRIDANRQNFFVFIGIGQLRNKIPEENMSVISNIFENINNYKNTNFIFVDNYNAIKNINIEKWSELALNNPIGLWLGEGLASQMAIATTEVDLETRKLNFPQLAFKIDDGKIEPFKAIVNKAEDTYE